MQITKEEHEHTYKPNERSLVMSCTYKNCKALKHEYNGREWNNG